MSIMCAASSRAITNVEPIVLTIKSREATTAADLAYDAKKVAALGAFTNLIKFEAPESVRELPGRVETFEKILNDKMDEENITVGLVAATLCAAAVAAGVLGLVLLASPEILIGGLMLSGIFLGMWELQWQSSASLGSGAAMGVLGPIGWLIIPIHIAVHKYVQSLCRDSAKKDIEEAVKDAAVFYREKGPALIVAIQSEIDRHYRIAEELANIPADPFPNSSDVEALRARAHFVQERKGHHANTLAHIEKLKQAKELATESIRYCASICN